MPIVKDFDLNFNSRVIIWEITELETQLISMLKLSKKENPPKELRIFIPPKVRLSPFLRGCTSYPIPDLIIKHLFC